MCCDIKSEKEVNVKKYSINRDYVGFITEDALDCLKNMESVMFLLTSLSYSTCDCTELTINKTALSGVFDMMNKEVLSILRGVKLSGGIFSESEAARGGILR